MSEMSEMSTGLLANLTFLYRGEARFAVSDNFPREFSGFPILPAVTGCLGTVPCGRLPTFTTDFRRVVISPPFLLTEWGLASLLAPALSSAGLGFHRSGIRMSKIFGTAPLKIPNDYRVTNSDLIVNNYLI